MKAKSTRPIRIGLAAALAVALAGFGSNPAKSEDHAMHHHHGHHMGHDMGHDMQAADHAQHAIPKGISRSMANYSLPDVPLVAASGKPVRLAAELDTDSPVLVNFIFTSCTAICPLTTAVFANVQDVLAAHGKPFRLISISIDPEQDTPARLREYAGKFGAGDNWHFLTGDAASVLAVQQAFGAWRGGKTNHAPTTFLRAARGAPWVRYDGMVDAETLVAEYFRFTANMKTVER